MTAMRKQTLLVFNKGLTLACVLNIEQMNSQEWQAGFNLSVQQHAVLALSLVSNNEINSKLYHYLCGTAEE